MKNTKRKITTMNVWDFKKSYPSVWVQYGEIIIEQINSDGFSIVEAGKEDDLKLTY